MICRFLNSKDKRQVSRSDPRIAHSGNAMSANEDHRHIIAPEEPPLPEIEFMDKSKVCSSAQLEKVIHKCPRRNSYFPWKLVYSTETHGISLGTFYEQCV